MNEAIKNALLCEAPDEFFRAIDPGSPYFDELAELMKLHDAPQNPEYHPEGSAFEHTMMVICEAGKVKHQAKDPLAFMLAALIHDLGKVVSTVRNKKGNWSSVGHENTGVPLAENMLRRIGADEETVAYCKNMCRHHMRLHTCYYGKARISRTNAAFDCSVCPKELVLLCICDARGTGKPRSLADEEEVFLMERLQIWQSGEAAQEDKRR